MKKIILCIMDGIGYREEEYGNAVRAAHTPNLDVLLEKYPHSLLSASGEEVGLPRGQMGNSEVGHCNIGSGRVVYQPLEIINNSIKSGEFYKNTKFIDFINNAKTKKRKLHLIGLLSDGGVHSHINHLFAFLDICKKEEFYDVFIHVITDGRDTSVSSGVGYINSLKEKLSILGFGRIASISGRYYTMDRDNNFDRIKKSYDILVNGNNFQKCDTSTYLTNSYNNNIFDEFINPALFDKEGVISQNDSVIFYNFRPDRLREIILSLDNSSFCYFDKKILNLDILTMMEVNDTSVPFAFSEQCLTNTLGEYLSHNNIRQLRIAETEKYPHVTYFFDGGVNTNLKGCDRILIASPKVATYDLMPEMSAYKITNKLMEVINQYDVIILNYANGDMVGHTGVFDKTVKAVEVVDECIGFLYKRAIKDDYTLIITADHGNSDYMLDGDGNIVTSHSVSPVLFIVCNNDYLLSDFGKLGDIAPTMLEIMGFDIPKEMTGESLIK